MAWLYEKYVNKAVKIEYNSGPNISGSYNSLLFSVYFLKANGSKVLPVLNKTIVKSLLIVYHGVSSIESNKYYGGGGIGFYYFYGFYSVILKK